MGTLRVRNLAQKVLFDEELKGQLSDGRWENSNPMDHWKPWCDATVVVDPEHVGRDFYARRDGYCFTEKDQLEIVGDRMLGYVQVAVDPNYTWDQMIKDLRDLRKIIKIQVASDLPVPPQPEGCVIALDKEQYVRLWQRELTVYVPTPATPAPEPELTGTMADFALVQE